MGFICDLLSTLMMVENHVGAEHLDTGHFEDMVYCEGLVDFISGSCY